MMNQAGESWLGNVKLVKRDVNFLRHYIEYKLFQKFTTQRLKCFKLHYHVAIKHLLFKGSEIAVC